MNSFNYQPRQVRFHGTLTLGRHRLKRYLIASAARQTHPQPDEAAWRALLAPVVTQDSWPNDHGIGFAILHFADDGDYLLLSTWCDANMLRHHVFTVTQQHGEWQRQSLADSRIIACVWELEVMVQERRRWIEQVMVSPQMQEKNVVRYLSGGFEGWV
jgi:hypothetical protein